MIGALSKRLTAMERKVASQRSRTQGSQIQYQFRLIPFCPPTTKVRVMAGVMYRSVWWYNGKQLNDIRIPENVIDFSDPAASEIDVDLTFSSASYYKVCLVAYSLNYLHTPGCEQYPADLDCGYEYKFETYGSDEAEYETATEAEAAGDLFLNHTMGNWLSDLSGGQRYGRFPLWIVVLRNDGRVDIQGAVLPVSPINRGGSYLYRDARVQNYFQ